MNETLLIDVIEKQFADKINANKICVMGNSGGGTATAYTAALEDRIVVEISIFFCCRIFLNNGCFRHIFAVYFYELGCQQRLALLYPHAVFRHSADTGGAAQVRQAVP